MDADIGRALYRYSEYLDRILERLDQCRLDFPPNEPLRDGCLWISNPVTELQAPTDEFPV